MKTRIWMVAMGLLATAATAGAQTMYDALTLSQNSYNGTARSIALGNAMTAVGGDLGSLTLNPAGSSVAGYSQITLTPNISISSYTSQGIDGFGDEVNTRHTRFNLYNIGMVMNMDTGNSYGIKRFSFGLVANSANNHLGEMYASGINGNTSFMGEMAVLSGGWASGTLNGRNGYETNAPWRSVLGYNAGMIATYGGRNDQYVGTTERVFDDGSIGVAGDLEQNYGRLITGNKTDFLLNVGMNISDILHLGFNLGMVSINYRSDAFIRETACLDANGVNPFVITFDDASVNTFSSARMRETLRWDASGVYAKIGAILTPGAGIRLGAAIQTPTAVTVNERYQMDGYTRFTNSAGNASSTSPENEYSFRLRSPFRVNVGAAWSCLNVLLVSADYEYAPYSTMRFRPFYYDDDRGAFDEVNREIRTYMGGEQAFRAGLEVKPVPALALRVGYAYATNPEKNNDLTYVDSNRQSVALGAGYSSNGSFFADFALRRTAQPDEYVYPYPDYITNDEGFVTTYSPEIKNTRSLWDITCTIGWRF